MDGQIKDIPININGTKASGELLAAIRGYGFDVLDIRRSEYKPETIAKFIEEIDSRARSLFQAFDALDNKHPDGSRVIGLVEPVWNTLNSPRILKFTTSTPNTTFGAAEYIANTEALYVGEQEVEDHKIVERTVYVPRKLSVGAGSFSVVDKIFLAGCQVNENNPQGIRLEMTRFRNRDGTIALFRSGHLKPRKNYALDDFEKSYSLGLPAHSQGLVVASLLLGSDADAKDLRILHTQIQMEQFASQVDK